VADDRGAAVELIHRLPERARFRVAGLKGDLHRARFLEQALGERAGIRRAAASPVTSTVLIRFAPGRPVEEVAAAIREAMAAELPEGQPAFTAPEGAARRPGKGWPPPWAMLSAAEVLRRFELSAEAGLSPEAVAERRRLYGSNRLPAMAPRDLPAIWKSQVTSLPVVLTAAAALLSLLSGALAEGALALAIVALNAAIGAFSENRSERLLDAVRESVELKARVVRGGRLTEIAFEEVVPGDLLDLQPGDRVAADARLVQAEGLGVDEAALTGESLPVQKSAGRLPPDEAAAAGFGANMLFRGTLVVEGSGRAVAVATGAQTVLGRLQNFLGAVFPPEALVAREMRRLSRRFALLGLGAAGLFAVAALWRGAGLLGALRGALALMGGAIPSGLSTLTLGAFARGHRELRRNRVLVRRLRALGNLASAQIVCFDKTGTLTRNRMRVAVLAAAGPAFRPAFRAQPPAFMQDADVRWLVSLATLCNEAFMVHEGAQSLEGSSTEQAIIRLAERAGMNSTAFRSDHPIRDIRHRSEGEPFMVTIHRWTADRELAVMKGSPHEVLERCGRVHRGGRAHPLGEAERSRIEAENSRMSGAGLRVLGVAYRWDPKGDAESLCPPGRGLVWSGLIGLSDPVRREAEGVIRGLQQAGLRTAVITGDQSLTAQHIGRELGLSAGGPLRILDAADLRALSPEGLKSVVLRTHVFARLSPTQKLQIIQAYQRAGLGVVMVGDGFNDVLALKVADVGIAMGRDGAELARRTADLVLEDDDLENVPRAVANGRAFYANMRRSLRFVLGAAHMDVAADLAARSGIGGAGPSPWQSVWGNLACLALALEPAAADGREPPPPADLITPAEARAATADAVKALAAAAVAGGLGRAGAGPGSDADRLLWQSVSLNQLLLAFTCRGRDGAAPPPNRRLQAVFWALAASHLFAALLAGGPVRAAGDILALAAGAALFRRLAQAEPSTASAASPPPRA
jgi:Ca2+-transporting ATPase